jgi:PEP-CTERM motif
MREFGPLWRSRLAVVVALACLRFGTPASAQVTYAYDGLLPNAGDASFTYNSPSFLSVDASTSCKIAAHPSSACTAFLFGSTTGNDIQFIYSASVFGFPVTTSAISYFPRGSFGAAGVYSTTQGTAAGTLAVTPPLSTPTPPPPRSTPNCLYVDVFPTGKSLSGLPINMTAYALVLPSLTAITGYHEVMQLPDDATTLAQAAHDLGYLGFDWVQTVTSGPSAVLLNGQTQSPTFFDPPPGGYLYCATSNHCPPGWMTSSPLYYNPIFIGKYILPSDTSLSFFDSPQHNLPFEETTFVTELVGYNACTSPGTGDCSQAGFVAGPALYAWAWEDDYFIGGGINITLSDISAPAGGTGGITLLAVPEPSTWALMLVGFGGLGLSALGRAGKGRRATAAA